LNLPLIIIDGVIFQIQEGRDSGVSRTWRSLIPELIRLLPECRFLFLQREQWDPNIPEIPKQIISGYDFANASSLDMDDRLLSDLCREMGASLFLSTYFSRAPGITNITMIYDLIPEILGFDLGYGEWVAKRRTIENSQSIIAISNSTKNDLVRFYRIASERINVIHLAVSGLFQKSAESAIIDFREKHRLSQPYFVIVGRQPAYKGSAVALKALDLLGDDAPTFLLIGTGDFGESRSASITKRLIIIPRLSDTELAIAYSGAAGLIYISHYEGFGLPILEAMACGCPVITCRNSSLPEVGGDACLYLDTDSPTDVAEAMKQCLTLTVRKECIIKGHKQSEKFLGWERPASQIAKLLEAATSTNNSISSNLKSRDDLQKLYGLGGPYIAKFSTSEYLVTAIVSTYSSERFIRGCIEGLLNQSLRKALEIIVIDSCSPQNEETIIREYQKTHSNIVYIKTPHREPLYTAWNRGIRAARGKFIINANTDDRLRHDAYEMMASKLEAHPEIALVYGDFLITHFENQTMDRHLRTGYCTPPTYEPDIMMNACHMGPQPMWRKSIHAEIGLFDDSLKSAGDYEFWCRISTRYPMKHMPTFLGLYLHNYGGIANSNETLSRMETIEVQARYKSFLPLSRTTINMSNHLQYSGDIAQTIKFAHLCMIAQGDLTMIKQTLESILLTTCYPHYLTVIASKNDAEICSYLSTKKSDGIIHHLLILPEAQIESSAINIGWLIERNAEYFVLIEENPIFSDREWLTEMIWVMNKIKSLYALAYGFTDISDPITSLQRRQIRIKKRGALENGCIMIPRRAMHQFGYLNEMFTPKKAIADYCHRLRLYNKKCAYVNNIPERVTKSVTGTRLYKAISAEEENPEPFYVPEKALKYLKENLPDQQVNFKTHANSLSIGFYRIKLLAMKILRLHTCFLQTQNRY